MRHYVGVDALSRFGHRNSTSTPPPQFSWQRQTTIPWGTCESQSSSECNSADQINEWYLSGRSPWLSACCAVRLQFESRHSHDLAVPAGDLGRLYLGSHWSLGALLVPAIRLLADLDQAPDVKLWELWRTVAYFPSGTGGPENDVMGDFWLWQPEQCGVFVDGNRQARLRLPLMPSTRFIWDALVRCRWCGGPVAPPSGQLRPNCR